MTILNNKMNPVEGIKFDQITQLVGYVCRVKTSYISEEQKLMNNDEFYGRDKKLTRNGKLCNMDWLCR